MARGMSRLPRRSRLWAKRMSRMWFWFAYEILLRSVALSSFDPPRHQSGVEMLYGLHPSLWLLDIILTSCHWSYIHVLVLGVEDMPE